MVLGMIREPQARRLCHRQVGPTILICGLALCLTVFSSPPIKPLPYRNQGLVLAAPIAGQG